jgi:hypothetical protein
MQQFFWGYRNEDYGYLRPAKDVYSRGLSHDVEEISSMLAMAGRLHWVVWVPARFWWRVDKKGKGMIYLLATPTQFATNRERN